jgi:hypothetical protein
MEIEYFETVAKSLRKPVLLDLREPRRVAAPILKYPLNSLKNVIWAVKNFMSSGFSLNFQSFSFILHWLMEVFPFVFYHPLELVNPCFEDSYEGFLSNFVENVGDRTFQALPVKDIAFGEFLHDIIKKEDVTWREVRAVRQVRYPLDLFV